MYLGGTLCSIVIVEHKMQVGYAGLTCYCQHFLEPLIEAPEPTINFGGSLVLLVLFNSQGSFRQNGTG